MFTIIYEKETGKVVNIASDSNAEELRKAIPESNDFIFVEELLPIQSMHRQYYAVENGKLVVKDKILTEKQDTEITYFETSDEINEYKAKLAETDYKALKFIDGELSEEEYVPIREERKLWREKINNLEEKYRELSKIISSYNN